MKTGRIVKLTVYSTATAAFVAFAVLLYVRLTSLSGRGFDADRYWAMVTFGVPVMFITAAFSFVMAIRQVFLLVGAGKAEREERAISGLNLTKNGDSGQNETQDGGAFAEGSHTDARMPEGDAQTAAPIDSYIDSDDETARAGQSSPSAAPESARTDGKRRKLTRKEKRKRKLLMEKEKKTHRHFGSFFGVAVAVITLVFCGFYAIWAAFPNNLCFHDYTFKDAADEGKTEDDYLRSYRFYQDYLGKPYYIYEYDNVEYKVRLADKRKEGNATVYVFSLDTQHKKLLDYLFNRTVTVTVRTEVRYYDDGHILVTHSERTANTQGDNEKVSERVYENKNYAYR